MSWLDTRTVMFGHLISGVICVLVLALLWHQNRKRFRGSSLWVTGFVLQTSGTLLILLRGALPAWASISLANFLLFGGAVIVVVGLRRFMGRLDFPAMGAVLFGMFSAGHVFFTFADPDLAPRTVVFAVSLWVLGSWGAYVALKPSLQVSRRITSKVGFVYIFLAAVNLVRLLGVVFGSVSNNDFFRTGLFDTMVLLAYQMIYFLVTFALVLMVNEALIAGIRLEEEKFSKAFRSSPYAMTLTRPEDGRILDVNHSFYRITGYTEADVVGSTTPQLRLWEKDEDRLDALRALKTAGRVEEKELRFRRKDGSPIVGLFSADVITVGDRPQILSSIADITERKRDEEALAESVREKELLMRELQHRVKNSLTVVSSLIGLGGEALGDPAAKGILADLKTRIGSVSSAYEQLDRTGRADVIHLRDYVLSLVESLTRSYGPADGRIRVETRLDDMALDTKRALPLGLILNELIINAFKYAYPGGAAGTIRVDLSSRPGGGVLSVSDDGVGGAVPSPGRGGTGSRLVAMLAEQIGARVTRPDGAGTTVTIEF